MEYVGLFVEESQLQFWVDTCCLGTWTLRAKDREIERYILVLSISRGSYRYLLGFRFTCS